ncbi:lysine transporter LysE [Streptomyces sp. PKU-EA00015]|uniref:lysine transporter LysE n=1 Tax=Streptomyces sp. PKU-EA00015 TaxID=2748326 RepID=UPI0015A3A07C|nr:lysine transporter LysE [Streptomyces sp. PKU-EA00015]NWF30987.1 lysine transporter LysE [Streptomyces sp. PKU-EA00015]
MTEILTTAGAGAVAGLGVAVPVGAIGVLLVQEAMRDRATAVAAASAVAVVDMSYAAVATALGPLVASALSGVEAWVRLASALILAAIAAHGLWSSVRGLRDGPADGVTRGGTGEPVARPRPARVFARFAALTAVNPTTALYFAALTTAQGAALGSGTAGAVFVGGVLVASLAWQQFLVAAAGYAGARISGTARAWTFRIGFGLVAVYAVKIALPLP